MKYAIRKSDGRWWNDSGWGAQTEAAVYTDDKDGGFPASVDGASLVTTGDGVVYIDYGCRMSDIPTIRAELVNVTGTMDDVVSESRRRVNAAFKEMDGATKRCQADTTAAFQRFSDSIREALGGNDGDV